uniref:Uncharacterized protein n=1 Tax=Panagrolaimus sp. ES5 TaxID=591445 RepID=A0AC34GVX2_9BILA
MEVFNSDPNKFIYAKYFTKRCIYSNGDDKDKNRDYMDLFMSARKTSILFPTPNISDFCFADLPAHWKYLERCILLQKFPTKKISSELVITEIYKNVAIAYDRTYVKQPVALFRHYCLEFDTLYLGRTFLGRIGKFFVPQQEDQQTLVLTDLFCTIKTFKSPIFKIPIEPNATNVIIPDFSFIVNPKRIKLKKYKNCHVMFCGFGAIIVPPELIHIFDHVNAVITSSIFYRIHGVEKDLFACWELKDSFTIYVNNNLYATCKYGIYHYVPKEELRLAFQVSNGLDEKHEFLAPLAIVDEENLAFEYPDFECSEIDEFVDYCIEKKRTRFRRM